MPQFLAELPDWPEIEKELRKTNADAATVTFFRKAYWDDFSNTEEVKAAPAIEVEARRSRFFQQPVTPDEPRLSFIEKAAQTDPTGLLRLNDLISPPGPPRAAPVVAPLPEVPLVAAHQPPPPGPMNVAQAIVAPMTGRTMADLEQRPLVVPSHAPVRPETTIGPAAGPLPPILPPIERRAPVPQTLPEQADAFVKGFGVGYEQGAATYQNELRDLTVGLAHRAGIIKEEPPRAKAPDVSGVPAGFAGSTGLTLGSLPAMLLSVFETAGIGKAEKAGRVAAKLIPRIVKSAADFAARFGTKTAVETIGAGETAKEAAKRGGISAAGAAVFGAAGPAAAETAAIAGRTVAEKLVESGVAVETAALVASAVERVVHGTIAATPIYPMAKAQGASDEQAITETLAWILLGARKSGAGEWAAKKTDAVKRGADIFQRAGFTADEAKQVSQTVVDLAESGDMPGAQATLQDTLALRRRRARGETGKPPLPAEAPPQPPEPPTPPARPTTPPEAPKPGPGLVTPIPGAQPMEVVNASAVRAHQGQRVPEAAQEGPQPQVGAQEGQGDRGAHLEQAPPREPEPVVEGGKGVVQEVVPTTAPAFNYTTLPIHKDVRTHPDGQGGWDLVYEQDGKPTDASMSITPAETGGYHVSGIRVPDEMQRQGIATKLFETASRITEGKRLEAVSRLSEDAYGFAHHILVDKGRVELVDADALAADAKRMHEIARQAGLPEEAFWAKVVAGEQGATAAPPVASPVGGGGRAPEVGGVVGGLPHATGELGPGAVRPGEGGAGGAAAPSPAPAVPQAPAEVTPPAAPPSSLELLADGLNQYASLSPKLPARRAANRLLEDMRSGNRKGIEAIALRWQNQITKGNVQGGPKEVKQGDPQKTVVAQAAQQWLQEHPETPAVPQIPAEVAPAPQSYTIEPASHAKNAIIVRVQNPPEFKGHKGVLNDIVEDFKGRFVSRENGYILPKSKEAKVRAALDAAIVPVEKVGTSQEVPPILSTLEVPTVPPGAKQPWEMTQAEYLRSGLGPKPQRGFGDSTAASLRKRKYELAQDWHRLEVRDALNAGNTIPPEVLAEYPDLKPAEVAAPVVPALESETVTATITAYQRKTPADVSQLRARRDKLEIRQEEINRPLETLKKDYEARRRGSKTREAAQKRYRAAVAAADEEARAIGVELGQLRKQSYDASLEDALLANPQTAIDQQSAELSRLGAAMNLLPKGAADAARLLATEELQAVATKESAGKSTPEEIAQAAQDGVNSLGSLPLMSADQHRGAIINSLVNARRARIEEATKDDPNIEAVGQGYGGMNWKTDLRHAATMKQVDAVEQAIADARPRGAAILARQETDRKAADLAEQKRVEKLNRPLPEGVREFSYKLTKNERFVLDNVGLGEDRPAIGGVTLGAGVFHKAADRLRSRGLVAPDSIILTPRGEDVARAIQQERMGLPYDQRPGVNWVPPDPLAVVKGFEGISGKAVGGLFADKNGDPWITDGHFLVRAKPGTKVVKGPAPTIEPIVNVTKADLDPVSGPVAWYRTQTRDNVILSNGEIVSADILAAVLGKEGGDLYTQKTYTGTPLDSCPPIYVLRGDQVHGVIMPIRVDRASDLPENYRWMWEDGKIHERELTKAPAAEVMALESAEGGGEEKLPAGKWHRPGLTRQTFKTLDDDGVQFEATVHRVTGRLGNIEEQTYTATGLNIQAKTLAELKTRVAAYGRTPGVQESLPFEGGGTQEALPFEGVGTEPLLRKAAPKAERIPVAPLPGGTEGETGQLIPTLAKSLARRVRIAKMKRGRLGQYEPSSTAMSIRYQGDLATTAHEIGHDLDDAYGITPLFSSGNYDSELKPFWNLGTKIPASKPNAIVLRRQEGWAEFLRAMIGNPDEARAQAPKLAAVYDERLPSQVRAILGHYSGGVRRFAGLSPEEMVRSNIEMEAASRTQRLRQDLAGTGYEFNTMGWADKLGSKIIDDLGRVMKGIRTAKELRGIDKLLPQDDPAILIRNWFGWTEERFVDMLANGVPIHNSLKRATGPFADLFEPLDASTKEKLQADYRDVVALLPAERVGERAGHIDAEVQAKIDQWDEAVADGRMKAERRDAAVARLKKIAEARKGRLAGWGHGIYSDTEVAASAVENLKRDPERFARLQKAADLYRKWCDAALRYNVDSGRMSEEFYQQVKARNQQYADMHRVASEIDPNYQSGGRAGGRKLGTPTETVQKFTGSTKKLGNPYINLMMQTAAILREADRNAAVRAFTDILTAPRKMGEGTPIPLEQIGRRVKEGTENAIVDWADGKPRSWQFEEGLHAELMALGKVPMAPAVLRIPASILRWSVVHSPPFQIRNAIRDAKERFRVSDVNSLPWDTLKGYTKEQLSDYLRAGGATGWYFHDRTRYALKLQETLEDLAKDETTILASWHSIKRGAERFYRGSELIGRMAEYRKAVTHGKEKLGYNDFNASLFAGNKARGLMDFNTAGSWIRWVNQIIPFTNPAVRGVVRNLQAMQHHPGRFMAAWVASILIPKLIEYLWNSTGDDAEEYRQLPDYQRDLFFNLKIAPNLWLRIPLGFEVAVWGGSVTRAIDYARGNKNAFDGHIGQLMRATLPLDETALAGPFRGIVQLAVNYDLFRNQHIIPVWEEGKDVRLRDTSRGSRLGQAVQQVLGVDARSVDFLLVESLGDLGRYVQELSNIGRAEKRPHTTADILRQVGAVFTASPAGQAKDVQAIFDTAQRTGMEQDGQVKHLRDLLRRAYESPTDKERDVLLKQMREYATRIRPLIERRAKQAMQTKGQKMQLKMYGAEATD